MNNPIIEIIKDPIARLPDMHGTRIPFDEQQPAIRPSIIHEWRAGQTPRRERRELICPEIPEVNPEEAALRPTDRDRPAIYQANNGLLSRVDTTRSTLPVIGAPVIVMHVDWSRPKRIAHVDQMSAHGDALDQSKYSRFRAPIGTRQPAVRAAFNEREV